MSAKQNEFDYLSMAERALLELLESKNAEISELRRALNKQKVETAVHVRKLHVQLDSANQRTRYFKEQLKEARKTVRALQVRSRPSVSTVQAQAPEKPVHCQSRDIVKRIRIIQESIQRGEYPNATTLAVQLRVSTKSVHRDLEYLRRTLHAPIAWHHDRHGYEWLQPETSLAVPGCTQTVPKRIATLSAPA